MYLYVRSVSSRSYVVWRLSLPRQRNTHVCIVSRSRSYVQSSPEVCTPWPGLPQTPNLVSLPPAPSVCRGCKEAALEGVIRVFDRLDAAAADATAEDGDMQIRRGGRLGASSTEHLRLVEGTILLHFNFAMKQDQYLASCLLKGFQRRAITPEIGRVFTPFRVALILSLSRIQRFSQQVLDLVQEIVTACLVYDHSREGSAWLQRKEEVCCGHDGVSRRARVDAGVGGSDGDSGGAGAQSLSAAGVVERVLLTVVRSSRGWDHLVGSLLKLGLQLLDRGGGGVSSSGVVLSTVGATKGLLEKLQASRSQQASLRASHLGRVVLMETFKTHEVRKVEVFCSELASQHVLGVSCSANNWSRTAATLRSTSS